ncbi:hypothetical protein [Leifsonia sp. 1010]|uniref:hypothetical protein n=1 Tax=Leifsonia sp. 1010 TaxID=2817769 RepID=UPI00285BD824|nr:ABC-type sugar transport system permease subunit [Leifsonia sp. 1010]
MAVLSDTSRSKTRTGDDKPAKKKRGTKYNRREAIAGYLFISPWIIGFLVFTLGAMLYSLFISFSNYNLATNSATPAGFDNYSELFNDPKVGLSLGNTLLPMLLLFGFGQRYFIEGVATQGRKG